MLTKAAEELLERIEKGLVVYSGPDAFYYLVNGLKRGRTPAASWLVVGGYVTVSDARTLVIYGEKTEAHLAACWAAAHKARCDAVSVEAVALLREAYEYGWDPTCSQRVREILKKTEETT